MADIRLKTITIQSSPLLINNGTVSVTNSNSITVEGGIGILNITDSTNYSSGGAITVAGGANINKNLYIRQNLNVSENFSVKNGFAITPTSVSIGSSFLLNESGLSIPNLNITGGMSINSSNNGLQVAGGSTLQKSLNTTNLSTPIATFGTLSISNNVIMSTTGNLSNNLSKLSIYPNETGNKILFYDGIGINVTDTDLKYHVDDQYDSHIFYSKGKNADDNINANEIFTIVGNGFVGINNTTPSTILDVNGEFAFRTKTGIKLTSQTLLQQQDTQLNLISKTWNNTINSITWSPYLNIFVAVKQDEIILSHDSINWTTINYSPYNWTKICWAPELKIFVICAIHNSNLMVTVSSDAINWGPVYSVNDIITFTDIIWCPDIGNFVIIAKNLFNQIVFLQSTNGSVWNTNAQLFATVTDVYSLCWSSQLHLLLALGKNTLGKMCTIVTEDLSIFDIYDYPSYIPTDLSKIIWSDKFNIFLAVVSDTQILSSTNAIDWNIIYTNSHTIKDVIWCFDLNLFTIVSDNRIFISYDTLTWNSIEIDGIPTSIIWVNAFQTFYIFTNNKIFYLYGLKPSTQNTLFSNNSYLNYNHGTGNISIKSSDSSYDLYVNSNVKTDNVFFYNLWNNDGTFLDNLTFQNIFGNNLQNTNLLDSTNIFCSNKLSTGNTIIETGSANNISSTQITVSNINSNSVITSNLLSQKINGNDSFTIGNILYNHLLKNLAINSTQTSSSNSIIINGQLNNSDSVFIKSLLLQNGGLSIKCTSDANSSSVGGSLTIKGGMSILKNTYVSDKAVLLDDVNFKGGLEIKAPTASLYVAGGAAIVKDLYVGGTVSTRDLYTTHIIVTDNVSDSLSCSGGITINDNTNALSITSGGALLVNGGTSFFKDIYLNGKQIINKTNYISQNANSTNIVFDNKFYIKLENNDLVLSYENAPMLRFINQTGQTQFNTTTGILISGNSVIGDLNVLGGVIFNKNINTIGDVNFTSTTESSTYNDGAVIIKGGVGVKNDLSVKQNMIVSGSLTSTNILSYLDTTEFKINDNLTVIKSNSVKHTGLLFRRFQKDNDFNTGDIIKDEPAVSFILQDQSALGILSNPTNTIVLPSSASNINDYYKEWWIKVESGFVAGQVRRIVSYNGSTRIATLSSLWNNNNPNIGDTIAIYNKPIVGIIFNKNTYQFEFVSTADTIYPSNNDITVTDKISLSTTNIILSSNLNISGGLSINNSANSNEMLHGGTLLSLGGAAFAKDIYVNGNLKVKNINVTPNLNDVVSSKTYTSVLQSDVIENLELLTEFCFNILLGVRVVTNTSKYYSNFNIKCINIDSEWVISKIYVGDDFGLNFTVNPQNKLEYTLPILPDFQSITFKWKQHVV